MKRKTIDSYVTSLNVVKNNVVPVQVTSIMADYTANLQTAAIDIFQVARMKECRFHFARAVFRTRKTAFLDRN